MAANQIHQQEEIRKEKTPKAVYEVDPLMDFERDFDHFYPVDSAKELTSVPNNAILEDA